MLASEVARAIEAARTAARSGGLLVDEAAVLQNSNKLTVRLLPDDVVARVSPYPRHVTHLELDVARQLADAGAPVGVPDPRVAPVVHEVDGFTVTLWRHYESSAADRLAPADYAQALQRLHAGMRTVPVATPHFTDRIEQAQRLVADRDRTPDVPEADRTVLADALSRLRSATGGASATGVTNAGTGGPDEQLLHGEPHPGNVLVTVDGPLFIDLETACRGPVEFDLAHAPEEVDAHYPGVDRVLLRRCRMLVLAMITAWRWDRADQLPDGPRLGEQWFAQLRAMLGRDDLE